MVLARTLALIAFAFPAASATAAPLDDLIRFDDPYRCVASKEFDALMAGVIQWRRAGETYKGRLSSPPVPAAYRKQVGRPKLAIEADEYRATLPLRGTWKGLPLHSLVVVRWVESEGGFYLVFDAPPEQVLVAANSAGWRIPASGGEYRDDDPIGVNTGVVTYEGKGSLYCIAG